MYGQPIQDGCSLAFSTPPCSTSPCSTHRSSSPFRFDLRHDVHGFAAADDQAHEHGFMGVAGNGDLLSAVGRRDDHHLVAAGGSVH